MLLFLFVTSHVTKTNIFTLLGLFLILMVGATRFEIGYDYFNYVSFYSEYIPDYIEPIFRISILLMNYLGFNYEFYFFIYSAVTILVLFYAIVKYTHYRNTALLLFVLIPGLYLNSFSIIRQSIALSFFFLAVYYLVSEPRLFKFWFFSLVSVGFHYPAAIVILFVYVLRFILSKELSLKEYLIILILSFIIYKINLASFALSLLGGKYSLYASFVQPVSLLKIIVSNLFILLLLAFKKQYIKSEVDVFILNLVFVGAVIINVFADFVPVSRLGYYFVIFQILVVPNLIYSFPSCNIRQISLKALIVAVAITYYVMMFFNALYVDVGQDIYPKMTPYKSWLFNDKV